jgi:hypothetical protein
MSLKKSIARLSTFFKKMSKAANLPCIAQLTPKRKLQKKLGQPFRITAFIVIFE